MLHSYVYVALLAATVTYAAAAGGAPERCAAAVMLAGSLLTPIVMADWRNGFLDVEWMVFTIDVADQLLLVVLALKADRFWPILVAAVHVLPLLTHLAKAVTPAIQQHVYGVAQAADSYLILLLILAGTWRHQRRLQRLGSDPSWSTSSASPVAMPRG